MSVVWSTDGSHESRGDVEPLVGLAVQLRALGAQFDTVAALAEGCDALVESGMMSSGGWL